MRDLNASRGTDVNLRSGPQLCEYAAIADRIAADRPGRLLDWGCGWGQVSALLLQRGVELCAFDYRDGIEHPGLRPLERYPEVAAYVSSEPVGLPYADGEFDAVLSCGVLEHVHDPDASLDEIRRVMRPGGRLYVYKLPNRLSYLEWVARRVGLYYHGSLPNDVVYDRGSARALLERHGFTVTDIRRTNLLPLTVDHPLATRHAERVWRINRALNHIPALTTFATNIEVDAVSRG
jgi:ubiquinone/menaquinone biosynthesis C-methylase UbiE